MYKIHWDFEIQMDHLIPARKPDLVVINQKKKKEVVHSNGFCNASRPQSENEKNETLEKYLDLARELKIWGT